MRALIAALLLCATASLQAAEVAGVRIDETARVAGTELKLNGAGLRMKAAASRTSGTARMIAPRFCSAIFGGIEPAEPRGLEKWTY